MVDKNKTVTLPFAIKKVLLNNYQKDYLNNDLILSPFETIVFEI